MSYKFTLTEQEKNEILSKYFLKEDTIISEQVKLTFSDGTTKTIGGGSTTAPKTGGEKKSGGTTPSQKYQKPDDLPDTLQFQRWLDINHPDWFTPTKPGSKSDDGIFGRQTSAAWEKYKDEFKKVLSGPGAGGMTDKKIELPSAAKFRENIKKYSITPQPSSSAVEVNKPVSQITQQDAQKDTPRDLPREQEATQIISSLAAETAKETLSYDTCVTLFKSVLGYREAGKGSLPDDRLKKDNPKAKGLKDTLQACLWQHNFGIGQGAVKIKKLYNLSSKGETK